MAFTLNAGEFDLGAGFIGRGTILSGESYLVGTSTTGVQGLLNTSGLVGLSHNLGGESYTGEISFRASNDPNLTGTILAGTVFAWVLASNYSATKLPNNARLHLNTSTSATGGSYNGYASYINTSTAANGEVIVSHTSYSVGNGSAFRDTYYLTSNWRFLARDHATALTHYPSTTEQGSVFAASCVNSATQWGLWIAGEVGDRSGYFNRIQGCFAIVLLVNGATTYFSAFSPAAENSTSRNDAPFRHFNIVPAAGQSTTDDKMSELLILRDLGSFESAYIGKVPGFFYIDPNKDGFDSYAIGEQVDIDPITNATFEGRDRALIVGRWGNDQALTASNTGALFTITSASPNRRTLENGRRIQLTTIAPTGMAINTNYWVINWNTTAFTFNLATIEGGSVITPTSNETGMGITAKAALLAMRCY